MLKRIRGRLTFANLAAAAALFVALASGTALSLSSGGSSKSIDPARNCHTNGVLTLTAGASPGANRAVCTVGSLLVRAVCRIEDTGDVLGIVRLSTSADHAFVASTWPQGDDPDFNVGEAGVVVADSGPHNVEEWQLGHGIFEASEAPAAGGRHLGGNAAVRTRFEPGSPSVATCQFAVDALTS